MVLRGAVFVRRTVGNSAAWRMPEAAGTRRRIAKRPPSGAPSPTAAGRLWLWIEETASPRRCGRCSRQSQPHHLHAAVVAVDGDELLASQVVVEMDFVPALGEPLRAYGHSSTVLTQTASGRSDRKILGSSWGRRRGRGSGAAESAPAPAEHRTSWWTTWMSPRPPVTGVSATVRRPRLAGATRAFAGNGYSVIGSSRVAQPPEQAPGEAPG